MQVFQPVDLSGSALSRLVCFIITVFPVQGCFQGHRAAAGFKAQDVLPGQSDQAAGQRSVKGNGIIGIRDGSIDEAELI